MTASSPATLLDDCNTRPAVSICIPAYQARQHLPATLDSVLSQDSRDFEVVIVDNNSSDGTGRLLEGLTDPRVRVLRNDATVSMIDNFNIAVRRSRGRYVKVVCADDTLTPDCVRVQSAVLDTMPGITLVSARTDFIDDDGELMRPDRGLPGIVGRQSAQHVVRRIVRSGTNPIGPRLPRCSGATTSTDAVASATSRPFSVSWTSGCGCSAAASSSECRTPSGPSGSPATPRQR